MIDGAARAVHEARRQPEQSGTSRRRWLRQIAIALLALPLARLGETVVRAEKRRRRHRGAGTDELWIGHC